MSMHEDQKSTTIRVSVALRDKIAKLAREAGEPMTAIIEEAISDYEHKKFMAEFRAAVNRTMADPAAWADYQAETAIFDNAVGDGLEPEDFSDIIPPRSQKDRNEDSPR